MEDIFFPIIEREKNLPFYVSCVGEVDKQHEINRPDGYYCPQIILCSEGGGVLQYGGEVRSVTAGSAFFLPAGSPHAYYATEDIFRTHYVGFAGYAAEILLRQLGLMNIGIYKVDIPTMRSIHHRMMSTLKTDKFYGGFSASAIVYEYIVEFNRQITGAENRTSLESASILPVLNYIDEHYNEIIELETLCGIIQVTPQYLCRMFKKRLGTRPLEYVAKKRIQQAKIYLTEGKMSIKEIALAVGYNDAGYFSSVFKRGEGISPREYVRRETAMPHKEEVM